MTACIHNNIPPCPECIDYEITLTPYSKVDFQILNHFAERCYAISKSRGFYDRGEPNFRERIALMHSELSEALEAYRGTHNAFNTWYVSHRPVSHRPTFRNHDDTLNKPEGVPSELADTIIRILDFCGANNIDIAQAVYEKIEYNKTRPYKHGKKF